MGFVRAQPRPQHEGATLRRLVLERAWYPEEFWLPTFALHAGANSSSVLMNRAPRPPNSQLCYRNQSLFTASCVPNCIGPREVEAIQRAEAPRYFAVKRVRRFLGDYVVSALLRGDGTMPRNRSPELEEQLRCRARKAQINSSP